MVVAKHKRKRKGNKGSVRPNNGMDIVGEIARLATEIATADTPGPLWGELHKVLLRSTVDPAVAAAIIMHRNEEELATVLAQLQGGEDVSLGKTVEPTTAVEIPFQTKKDAMRMFRNRAKFIKLDRESKLGSGPLTYGKEAKFDSIEAPHEFPHEVWQALAQEGQLVEDGGGFYRLP